MDTFLIDFCNSAYDTFVWLQLRYLLYSVHNVNRGHFVVTAMILQHVTKLIIVVVSLPRN